MIVIFVNELNEGMQYAKVYEKEMSSTNDSGPGVLRRTSSVDGMTER